MLGLEKLGKKVSLFCPGGLQMVNKKEFGDWAIVYWKKGSKTLHIAQNQGDLGTTDFWMVGTTTRQFDYESGWLPNKEWTSALKGHFPKAKAVLLAKQAAVKEVKGLTESHKKLPSYLAEYGATHFSELWEVANCKDPEGEDFDSFSKLGRVIRLPKYGPTQYEISRDSAGVITVDVKQGRFTETIAIPTGFAEEFTCNECGEEISEWEYQRYSGCCESCYRESMYGSDDEEEEF